MLRQSRSVRISYAAQVLDGKGNPEVWMLRQPEHVRESYISEVLQDA